MLCVCHSLREGVVVSVALRYGCGEELGRGHQARGAWWRLRLALGELQGPLVGHLLDLRTDRLGRERVHLVSKQSVCSLGIEAETSERALHPADQSQGSSHQSQNDISKRS